MSASFFLLRMYVWVYECLISAHVRISSFIEHFLCTLKATHIKGTKEREGREGEREKPVSPS